MKTTESNNPNSPNLELKSDLPSGDRHTQFVLPRSGWQDKKAWLKAVIRAKRALDLAEINHLLMPLG